MKVFKYLISLSPRTTLLSALIGMLSGMSGAAVVAMINVGLTANDHTVVRSAWIYFGMCAVSVAFATFSQMLLIRLSQSAVFKLRMDLCNRILQTPLRRLEAIGSPRLLSALTENTLAIAQAISSVPMLCVHVAMILGCLIFLAYLSPMVLATIVMASALSIGGFLLISRSGMHFMRRAHDEQDRLFFHFRTLVEGIKELKLHRERCDEFFDRHLHATAGSLMHNRNRSQTFFAAGSAWTSSSIFLLVGLFLFALPALNIRAPTLKIGPVMTIMFMLGPITGVVSMMPVFSRASVVLEKLRALGIELDSTQLDTNVSGPSVGVRPWGTIALEGITHTYLSAAGEGIFKLGPIDLAFRAGERVFLVGGNGSGKTTLAKLISGLYAPDTGNIRSDGRILTPADLHEYRQNFSVVFSDAFLFDSLLGAERNGLDKTALYYLKRLGLSDKLSVNNGKFSTLNLSQGQRKRVALLTAFVENRSFYILDEWAADQDPSFRNIFYHEILDDLKARKKTVMVITHDDRYFNLADRIVKLEYGRQAQ